MKKTVIDVEDLNTDAISNLSTIGQDRGSKISRSTIMSSAKSFHYNFKWSCKNKNLASLNNWTKPRYEATQLNSYDRVAHTSRSVSSLSSYVLIRYNNVK